MGNSYSSNSSNSSTNSSAEKEFNNFYDIIDYIATYYILTMDFKSLSKLSEKAYCDKLVVLTSDIIERYFNNMEITYLAQRIKDGVEVDENQTSRLKLYGSHLDRIDPSGRYIKHRYFWDYYFNFTLKIKFKTKLIF